MTTVYWCPVLKGARAGFHESLEVFFQQPDPLFKAIAAEHPDTEFLACPSVQEFCRDTYVVRAPFDVTYTYHPQTDMVTTDKKDHAHFDSLFKRRPDGSCECMPSYVFYAGESVRMEVMPVFLLKSATADAVHFIPGEFDIGKWIRPVMWDFFVKDPSKPIAITKGDPLFFVRFTPSDGSRVEFERVEYDFKMMKVTDVCLGVKYFVPGIPLRRLYKLAESYIKHFLRRNV